jgi:hypothetical protein
MKTIKVLKNNGKYLTQLRAIMKNFVHRKKPDEISSKNYILVNKGNDTKIFFKINFYVKTKTIVYYHLRQCLRETRLSSQSKQ